MASLAAFMDSLSGERFICPSETAEKAPFWYITPDMLLGKEELFTRFSTTAATAISMAALRAAAAADCIPLLRDIGFPLSG